MSDHDTANRIIAFARHCGPESEGPERFAMRRGWIDRQGAPTEEGRALIAALDGQDATRSVFRTLP
jgi:hypothetical protein